MSSKTRAVALDAATRARWAGATGAFELGLLLGQLGRRGPDVVLAASPVPPESESGETDGFADVSVEWVRDCAQQAERMLPGGVGVVGLYVQAPSLSAAAVFDKAVFYLRELAAVTAIGSPLAVLYVAYVAGAQPPVFRSFSGVSSAAKMTSAVAELVDVPGGITLKKYHTLVGVSETVVFSPSEAGVVAEDLAEKRAAELKQGLEPFLIRVRAAVCIPQGEATDSQLMKLLAPAQSPVEDANSTSLVGRVKGSIRGIAYVCATESEPTKLAVEYLKSDLLKTVMLRVELASEKWVDEAEVYTFPGNDDAQMVENALEILGGLVSIADGPVVKSIEHEWTQVEQDTRSRDERIIAARKDDPDFAPMPYHYVLMLIPVALALVYLLVQQGLMVQRDFKGYD